MAERKDPTNQNILNELKGMNHRIGVLEQWKLSEDAYRAALKQIKDEAESKKYIGLRDNFLKQLGVIAALVVLILTAYAATKGLK